MAVSYRRIRTYSSFKSSEGAFVTNFHLLSAKYLGETIFINPRSIHTPVKMACGPPQVLKTFTGLASFHTWSLQLGYPQSRNLTSNSSLPFKSSTDLKFCLMNFSWISARTDTSYQTYLSTYFFYIIQDWMWLSSHCNHVHFLCLQTS